MKRGKDGGEREREKGGGGGNIRTSISKQQTHFALQTFLDGSN